MSDPDSEQPTRGRAAELAASVSSLADAWNRVDFRRRMVLAGLGLRQGGRRVRGSFLPILTASVAAWLAYSFSHEVLGHPTPFLAPVAAWICLGFTYNRVPRKVVEIGAGAAIGVGIGELILLGLGAGAWQLALGLMVAGLIARLLDRGDLFTIQSGVNAMVVIGMGTMYSQLTGAGPSRLVDALVGAAIAFLLAVLLPGDVVNRPRRYVSNLHTELATTFGMLGDGLRSGNRERLRDAHAQLRGVQRILDDARTVWKSSADIVALNPTMRRHRPEIEELGRQLELSTRAVHTVELLLRQSRGVVDETGPLPVIAKLMDAADHALLALAGSVRHWQPPQLARQRAITLAADCAPERAHVMNWRTSALLSVLRSVAIDLLQLTGLSREQARFYLPGTGPEVADSGPRLVGDEPSEVWGSAELTT
ncbi:MAG TPA: FUSC family protein [Micropruina sp.]|nr:FUSC family protein [Micropruina sp.]